MTNTKRPHARNQSSLCPDDDARTHARTRTNQTRPTAPIDIDAKMHDVAASLDVDARAALTPHGRRTTDDASDDDYARARGGGRRGARVRAPCVLNTDTGLCDGVVGLSLRAA